MWVSWVLVVIQISIHVPARGTTTVLPIPTARSKFQSTFPQGERQLPHLISPFLLDFNPRSRKGNDGFGSCFVSVKANFNPRSRKGNDRLTENRSFQMDISIHVPARGTTLVSIPIAEPIAYFNPRSRKGNDYVRWCSL